MVHGTHECVNFLCDNPGMYVTYVCMHVSMYVCMCDFVKSMRNSTYMYVCMYTYSAIHTYN